MVENLKQHCAPLGINVVNLAEAPLSGSADNLGCGCATMSRNDPPHLIGLIDQLRQGKNMPYNELKAGDEVNEFSGIRRRLHPEDQQWVIDHAKLALQRMIDITEN